MSSFYANITTRGPAAAELAAYLRQTGQIAYVSPAGGDAAVIFHSDLGGQEALAGDVSRQFNCPALLVMAASPTTLLYQLYRDGEQIDSYVSSPHDELDLGDSATPAGDADILCEAFELERAARGVRRVLDRPTDETRGYALAVNRHGELARALRLPLFAAGAGFDSIEIGELPAGNGFDPGSILKTF